MGQAESSAGLVHARITLGRPALPGDRGDTQPVQGCVAQLREPANGKEVVVTQWPASCTFLARDKHAVKLDLRLKSTSPPREVDIPVAQLLAKHGGVFRGWIAVAPGQSDFETATKAVGTPAGAGQPQVHITVQDADSAQGAWNADPDSAEVGEHTGAERALELSLLHKTRLLEMLVRELARRTAPRLDVLPPASPSPTRDPGSVRAPSEIPRSEAYGSAPDWTLSPGPARESPTALASPLTTLDDRYDPQSSTSGSSLPLGEEHLEAKVAIYGRKEPISPLPLPARLEDPAGVTIWAREVPEPVIGSRGWPGARLEAPLPPLSKVSHLIPELDLPARPAEHLRSEIDSSETRINEVNVTNLDVHLRHEPQRRTPSPGVLRPAFTTNGLHGPPQARVLSDAPALAKQASQATLLPPGQGLVKQSSNTTLLPLEASSHVFSELSLSRSMDTHALSPTREAAALDGVLAAPGRANRARLRSSTPPDIVVPATPVAGSLYSNRSPPTVVERLPRSMTPGGSPPPQMSPYMSSEASPSWARTPDTRGAYPPSAKQHPRSIGPEKSQARDFDQVRLDRGFEMEPLEETMLEEPTLEEPAREEPTLSSPVWERGPRPEDSGERAPMGPGSTARRAMDPSPAPPFVHLPGRVPLQRSWTARASVPVLQSHATHAQARARTPRRPSPSPPPRAPMGLASRYASVPDLRPAHGHWAPAGAGSIPASPRFAAGNHALGGFPARNASPASARAERLPFAGVQAAAQGQQPGGAVAQKTSPGSLARQPSLTAVPQSAPPATPTTLARQMSLPSTPMSARPGSPRRSGGVGVRAQGSPRRGAQPSPRAGPLVPPGPLAPGPGFPMPMRHSIPVQIRR